MIRDFDFDDVAIEASVMAIDRREHRRYWEYSFAVDGVVLWAGDDLSTYHTRTEEQAMNDLLFFCTNEGTTERTEAQLDWLASGACQELAAYIGEE